MTKPRAGYHTLVTQIPDVLWDALCADAARNGVSATRALTRVLQKHYRVPADKLPPPQRAGRKPKGR